MTQEEIYTDVPVDSTNLPDSIVDEDTVTDMFPPSNDESSIVEPIDNTPVLLSDTKKTPKEEAYITIGVPSDPPIVPAPYDPPEWYITQCPNFETDEVIIGDAVIEYLQQVHNWSHIQMDTNDRVMAVDADNRVRTGYYVCRKKLVEEPTP